jgi:hypothetical protein
MKSKSEYQRFREFVATALSVPRSEIKVKLDAEKKAKKRRKARKSSAVVRAGV